MRRLRGRAIDPFGHAKVRRVERELIGEYRELVSRSLDVLAPDTAPLVLEICDLPDEIRGYEEIKLRNIKRFQMTAERLERKLAGRARSKPRPDRPPPPGHRIGALQHPQPPTRPSQRSRQRSQAAKRAAPETTSARPPIVRYVEVGLSW